MVNTIQACLTFYCARRVFSHRVTIQRELRLLIGSRPAKADIAVEFQHGSLQQTGKLSYAVQFGQIEVLKLKGHAGRTGSRLIWAWLSASSMLSSCEGVISRYVRS